MSTEKPHLKANITPFGLRMQPELKAYIEGEAEKNNRSINAEIVHRLELTRDFDFDVGYEAGLRRELGPVAAFIEDKLREQNTLLEKNVRHEVNVLREELSDFLKALGIKPPARKARTPDDDIPY